MSDETVYMHPNDVDAVRIPIAVDGIELAVIRAYGRITPEKLAAAMITGLRSAIARAVIPGPYQGFRFMCRRALEEMLRLERDPARLGGWRALHLATKDLLSGGNP